MTEYKQKLEEEKKALTEQLQTLGKRDPKTNEWEATSETANIDNADANTNADRYEDFEENSAVIVPLEARLAQIENALQKIDSGTFGVCRVCGKKIEEARLEANPAAETCVEHLES